MLIVDKPEHMNINTFLMKLSGSGNRRLVRLWIEIIWILLFFLWFKNINPIKNDSKVMLSHVGIINGLGF